MAPSSHHLHDYHHHNNRTYNVSIAKKVAWSLLLWFVGLTYSSFLILLYCPNPFAASPLLLNDPNTKLDNTCDLGVGRWVREVKSPPAYNNRTCRTMPESTNCGKYGKDMDYLNWRWKPEGCELQRFDAGLFLKMVHGKKMAFVGDSVARNQFESLLCLLSQVETPIDSYKDPDDRFRTWVFPSHSFTLMVLWTRFLVQAEERTINGSSSSGVFDLHVDKIESKWTDDLPTIDIVIVSTGHWFFRKNYLYESEKLLGCIFCSEPNVTTLTPSYSIQKVFRNALEFISNCGNCEGHVTLLRTFSPAHFEGGAWNGGGNCNRTQPTSEVDFGGSGTYWEISRAQVEEIERAKRNGGKKKFEVLDVTRAMLMRGDAHPGSHWNNEWMKGYNDCVHWCLPGPVDLWNELLMAVMEKW